MIPVMVKRNFQHDYSGLKCHINLHESCVDANLVGGIFLATIFFSKLKIFFIANYYQCWKQFILQL